MNIYEVLKKRKSIRGYKPDPVSKEILQKIIEAAVRAPSAMNTQPWKLYVIAGDTLDKIKKGNIESLISGNLPAPDIPLKKTYQDIFKKRQVDLANQIFKLMGIEKDDKDGKFNWMQRGFQFFNAPAAIILTYDEILDPAFLYYFDLSCLCVLLNTIWEHVYMGRVSCITVLSENILQQIPQKSAQFFLQLPMLKTHQT